MEMARGSEKQSSRSRC